MQLGFEMEARWEEYWGKDSEEMLGMLKDVLKVVLMGSSKALNSE